MPPPPRVQEEAGRAAEEVALLQNALDVTQAQAQKGVCVCRA